MAAILIILFFLSAIAVVGYSGYLAWKLDCPNCFHEGQRRAMIPIGGPFLWMCLECDSRFSFREAQRAVDYEKEERDSTRAPERYVVEDDDFDYLN
jgi:hypothetical protein